MSFFDTAPRWECAEIEDETGEPCAWKNKESESECGNCGKPRPGASEVNADADAAAADDDDLSPFWQCGVCADSTMNMRAQDSCRVCHTGKKAATAAFKLVEEVRATEAKKRAAAAELEATLAAAPATKALQAAAATAAPVSEIDRQAAEAAQHDAALCHSIVPRLCATAVCLRTLTDTPAERAAAARIVVTHLAALYSPLVSEYRAKHAVALAAAAAAAASVERTAALPVECTVCASQFDGHEVALARMHLCGHQNVCAACVDQMVRVAVESGDVLPYIKCAEPQCGAPIAVANLVGLHQIAAAADDVFVDAYAQTATLARIRQLGELVCKHAQKVLRQKEHFAECSNGDCRGGFALTVPEVSAFHTYVRADRGARAAAAAVRVAEERARHHGGGHVARAAAQAEAARLPSLAPPAPLRRTCQVCQTVAFVTKVPPPLDPELQEMMDTGCLKPCPACSDLNIKEQGICNVINCGRCGIWWNWATLETGRSSDELKQKARSNGTLWNPGELEWQQRLEQTDKPAFIAFLARNGIEYDPNYRRGS